MMQINYAKKFQKAFLKLDTKRRGKRSFSVTGDMRIIFEEHENYTMVLMLDVGTHNQVY